MNRAELQQLAELRLKESQTLLDAACHEGAYYLAGYALECALKSCIARKTQQYDFPDRKLVNQIFTHNLVQLVRATGLENELQKEIQSNPEFGDNWDVAKDWSEESRYLAKIQAQTARDLYAAISDNKFGVLPWLKKFW
jgi:hypothetical protein